MQAFKARMLFCVWATAVAWLHGSANGASDELVKAALKDANLMIYGTT
jgi:hypothetical protein